MYFGSMHNWGVWVKLNVFGSMHNWGVWVKLNVFGSMHNWGVWVKLNVFGSMRNWGAWINGTSYHDGDACLLKVETAAFIALDSKLCSLEIVPLKSGFEFSKCC